MAAVREKNEKNIADGAEKSVLCSLWMVQIMLVRISCRPLYGRREIQASSVCGSQGDTRRKSENRCSWSGKYSEGERIYVLP